MFGSSSTCDSRAGRSTALLESLYITTIATLFIAWLTKLFLERCCGMFPTIRRSLSLKTMRNIQLNVRMSKRVDRHGNYRMQISGSTQFVKSLWKLVLVAMLLYQFSSESGVWYYYHFIDFNCETNNDAVYLHCCCTMVIMYPWELTTTSQYSRLNIHTIMHHWLTTIAAISIICGSFNPFATWYGITQVALTFPQNILMGMRAAYSHKYPSMTRAGFTAVYVHFACITALNLSGQMFLIFNGFFVQKKVSIFQAIWTLISIIVWANDDYRLLKTLKEYSQMKYEDNQLIAQDEPNGTIMRIVSDIIHQTQQLPSLKNQIRVSSLSVMSNVGRRFSVATLGGGSGGNSHTIKQKTNTTQHEDEKEEDDSD